MKKILITILSLCVILVMSGCGKKADQEAGCYAPVGEDGIWYCTILDRKQDGEHKITVYNIKGKETSKVKIIWVHFPDSEKKDELAFVAPQDYLNSEYHVEF